MPTTAYKAGGTFAGNAGSTSNISASNDTRSSHNNGQTAIVTNFTFGLPSGATIDGVELQVESRATGGTWTQVVQLYNGSAIGNSKSTTGITSTTDETRTYGGAADLWSATLTQAIVNGTGFGVIVTANRTAGTGGTRFEIDSLQMRITYTESSGPTQLMAVKLGGVFSDKPTKIKLGGTFVEKQAKIKIGGVFQ